MLPNLSGLSLTRGVTRDLSQLLLGALHTDGKADSSRSQAARDRRDAPYKKGVQKEKPSTSAVADMARVLAKGGRFMIHVPRPGEEDWRATFTIEQGRNTEIRMYRTGEPEDLEDDEAGFT